MKHSHKFYIHRKRGKSLGVWELVAIAIGGMVGGGIFTILGISVAMVGAWTPLAIIIGGMIAGLAAYSYVKLGVYYLDEGATYAFVKRTFPKEPFAASLLGWWVIFGYISTLALYAYTFSAYAISSTHWAQDEWVRKAVAGGIIAIFTLINIWSVKGMGRIEDLMVYTKLLILVVISVLLIRAGDTTLPQLLQQDAGIDPMKILIVASITFVAYEGFQLVINATNEMDKPKRNIPRAIYTAIFLVVCIYVIIALGAILAIPFPDIIKNKEYALAAGAKDVLGETGNVVVIIGALLATMSAISGTVFGASRQLAAIAEDGYFPALMAKRSRNIPVYAILTMSTLAFTLILSGSLRVILEFGSITFLLVSFLMAWTNYKIRDKTNSHPLITLLALFGLAGGAFFILYYEATKHPEQLIFVGVIYAILTAGAYAYARLVRARVMRGENKGAGK